MVKKYGWRLLASLFGALEVTILNRYLRKARLRGEEYFFDRLEFLHRRFHWGTRVVPVGESIRPGVKVLPTDEIREIVRRSRVHAVTECWCRKTFRKCDHPVETCLVLSFAEDRLALADRGLCSRVSQDRVQGILDDAERRGLVHQLVCCSDPAGDVYYVICNCCPCCCIGLQSLIRFGKDLVRGSGFIAEVSDECDVCGKCAERCHFGARLPTPGRMSVDPGKCLGCGLCVPSCEKKATFLVYRKE